MTATSMSALSRNDHAVTELRSFDDSLPMALLKAREATMRRFRPMLGAHDLTEQQWRVIRALASMSAEPSVGELAEATFLLGPSLSRILVNLEGRHLIERTASAADNRSVTITLTDRGRKLFATVAPESETIYRSIEGSFSPQRLGHLLTELEALADSTTNDSSTEEAP